MENEPNRNRNRDRTRRNRPVGGREERGERPGRLDYNAYAEHSVTPAAPRQRRWSSLTAKMALLALFLVVLGSLGAWLFSGVAPWHQAGEVAYKQQEYREELRAREQRVQRIERHNRLGNLFLSRGQASAAGQEFKSALELDPKGVEAQLGKFKAEIFEPIERGENAPEVFTSRLEFALAENPEDAHIHAYLGHVYLTLNPAKSETLFRKSLSLDPDVSTAYVGLGTLFDQRQRSDSAIHYYEKAVAVSEWNQPGLLLLGSQYLRMGENQKALEKFDVLLGLDPQYLLAHFYRALALVRDGRWDDASVALKQVLSLAEQDAVMGQTKNAGKWIFNREEGSITMATSAEKAFYARALSGVVAHMQGRTQESRDHLGSLAGLETGKKKELLALAGSDLGFSCSGDDSCIRKLAEFRSRNSLP